MKILTIFRSPKAVLSLMAIFLFLTWNITPPAEITLNGWRITMVFVATIAGVMSCTMPMGMVVIMTICFSVITNIIPINKAFSGFASTAVWLIIGAFCIAKAVIKTGLGERVAYYLISKMGSSLKGIAYSLLFTDFLISPFIPSATARAGGIFLPIGKALITEFKSEKQDSAIAKFIMMIIFHSNIITNTMFLTAMAGNPIAVRIASNLGIQITWIDWAIAALIPGIISIIALPLILGKLCGINDINQSKNNDTVIAAKNALQKLGPLTKKEAYLVIIFIGLISMWMLEQVTGINAAIVALVGMSALLLTKIIEWQDVIEEKGAWDTMIWYGGLLMLADAISGAGSIQWLVNITTEILAELDKGLILAICGLFFFYIHYFFASTTAHLTAMLAPFILLLTQTLGFPAVPAALGLTFLSSLSGGLTHYGISPAPLLFGVGYVSLKSWWQLSGITATWNFALWIFTGFIWWRILGWI